MEFPFDDNDLDFSPNYAYSDNNTWDKTPVPYDDNPNQTDKNNGTKKINNVKKNKMKKKSSKSKLLFTENLSNKLNDNSNFNVGWKKFLVSIAFLFVLFILVSSDVFTKRVLDNIPKMTVRTNNLLEPEPTLLGLLLSGIILVGFYVLVYIVLARI